MKQFLLLLASLATVALLAFSNPPNTLVGRWQQKFSNNVIARSNYRADGTLDIFIDGKTFVSGKYRVSGDTMFIADPACGVNYYGWYRLTFITPDSVRQIPIQDTCQVRNVTISQSSALSRIKSVKP